MIYDLSLEKAIAFFLGASVVEWSLTTDPGINFYGSIGQYNTFGQRSELKVQALISVANMVHMEPGEFALAKLQSAKFDGGALAKFDMHHITYSGDVLVEFTYVIFDYETFHKSIANRIRSDYEAKFTSLLEKELAQP